MLCEGLELFLLYDPNDTKRPFTITDAIITHQNIRKGCVVFSISEILCKALMIKVLDPYTADLVKFYENNNKRWLKVRISIHQAISYLDKYVFSFSVQNGQPTYGDVKFTNPNIKFFNRLKKYVGVFGFVVSIIGS